ncbi:MAG: hypothetical protein AAF171_07000 [Cyanobacteria bacterium P01_A01_bin.116]
MAEKLTRRDTTPHIPSSVKRDLAIADPNCTDTMASSTSTVGDGCLTEERGVMVWGLGAIYQCDRCNKALDSNALFRLRSLKAHKN